LLVACAAEAVPQVLEIFKTKGFAPACVIGKLSAGAPTLTVT
jgi:selenide,water dikinase